MAEGIITNNLDNYTEFRISIARMTAKVSDYVGGYSQLGKYLFTGFARFYIESAETGNQYIDAYSSDMRNIRNNVSPFCITGTYAIENQVSGIISSFGNANAWFLNNSGNSISLSPYIGKLMNISYTLFYYY